MAISDSDGNDEVMFEDEDDLPGEWADEDESEDEHNPVFEPEVQVHEQAQPEPAQAIKFDGLLTDGPSKMSKPVWEGRPKRAARKAKAKGKAKPKAKSKRARVASKPKKGVKRVKARAKAKKH